MKRAAFDSEEYPYQYRWTSFSPLTAQIEQKGKTKVINVLFLKYKEHSDGAASGGPCPGVVGAVVTAGPDVGNGGLWSGR